MFGIIESGFQVGEGGGVQSGFSVMGRGLVPGAGVYGLSRVLVCFYRSVPNTNFSCYPGDRPTFPTYTNECGCDTLVSDSCLVPHNDKGWLPADWVEAATPVPLVTAGGAKFADRTFSVAVVKACAM